MPNINNDIRVGFFNKLLTGTALKAAVAQVSGGTTHYKIYYQQAPQEIPGTSAAVVLPYVTMSILPILQDRDSVSKWYAATVQFLVAALTPGEAETIAGHLTDLLEDCESTLTIGLYTTVQITRGEQVNLGAIDEVENIAVQYGIIIER